MEQNKTNKSAFDKRKKQAASVMVSAMMIAFLCCELYLPVFAENLPDESSVKSENTLHDLIETDENENELFYEGESTWISHSALNASQTSVSIDQAMKWCESKLGKKVGTGQCVALISAYYTYLGAKPVSGNACDYATNSLPSGWSRVKGGTPKKGDILVYTGAKYGHVAIYAGGTTSYHQNMSGLYVEKKTSWKYNNSWDSKAEGGRKSYWGYIRPNWPDSKPSKPAITSWSAGGMDSVTIKWGAVSRATSYTVKRRKKVSGTTTEYEEVKSGVTGTSFTDTGLEAGTMYYYKVTAVNSSGSSAASDSCRVWTRSKAPKVEAVGSTSVKITWDTVEFAATYRIDRRVAEDGTEYTTIKTGITGTSYTDTSGLTQDTPYYYRVYPVGGEDTDYITVRSETSAKVRTLVAGSEMSGGYDRVLPDGDYMIVSAADPGYYLDIQGGDASAANGTNVQIYGPATGNLAGPDVWTITYSDGFYTICQKDSTAALDVKGGNRDIGVNVQAWKKNGTSSQKWAVSVINWSEKGYRIQAKCSGMSLDIAGGNIASGTNIRQYTGNTSDAQRWLFIPYEPGKPVEDGRYVLVSGMDPHVEMDVPGNTGDIADGTGIQIWNDGTNSRYNSFDVKNAGNGYYNLVHAASGKYIGVKGETVDNYGEIQLSAPDGSDSQKWCMVAQNGGYMLVNRHSGLVMDVDKGKTENATKVQQHFYNGSKAQTWVFRQAENTVSYDANGGTGAPSAQTKYYANTLTLSTVKPSNGNNIFKGWATKKDASEAQYQPGAGYTEDSDMVLYAVWEELEEDLVLPAMLREIEEEAFEGGTFRCVRLGENVEVIGNRAFADCGELRYIIIPEKTTSIASNAFEGTSGLTIIGEKGSYAEQYAQSNGLNFMERME